MAMSFVKIYFDFEDRTAELNEVEKGRLLLAMLKYAQTGEAPQLKGNERFLFPVFKGDIDRDAATYATKIENGAKGGRQTANRTEPNRTESNLTEPNVTETELIRKNKNKNKNKTEEQDIGGVNARAHARMTPPTVDEVRAYAIEKGWTAAQFDADRFVDFYASKGWKVGREPMRDWKASARNWAARDRGGDFRPGAQAHVNPALDYDQRTYSADDYGDDFYYNDMGRGTGT